VSTPGGTEYTVRSFRVRRVLAALLALPVIELAIAIAVAGWIGVWPTVIALFLLSATGFLVLRREGRQALRALGGQPITPGADLRRRDPADAALVALAGLLLLVPGFLTALGGLVLLIPPVRRWVRRRIARSAGQWPVGGSPVIQGEVLRVDTVEPTERPRDTRPPEDPSAGPPAVTG
jgi:UPF0716 family protein affecting phage T7 exclusion